MGRRLVYLVLVGGVTTTLLLNLLAPLSAAPIPAPPPPPISLPLAEHRLVDTHPAELRLRGSLPRQVMQAYASACVATDEGSFHSALRSYPHPFLELLDASALLGAIDGAHPLVGRDPVTALAILDHLDVDDPGNGLSHFLRALAFRELGQMDASAAALEHALQSTDFRTYSERLSKTSTALPLPNLYPAADLLLEKVVLEGPLFAEQVLAFGRRLIVKDSRDADIGRHLARTAWRKLHLDQSGYPEDLSLPVRN